MQKYLAIINSRTAILLLCCAVITWACRAMSFSYDLNVTLFSIAVVFPLVFTIREAFKRRDAALEFLSQFKSAVVSVHYAFEQSPKLNREQKDWATLQLGRISDAFFGALSSNTMNNDEAERRANELISFIQRHREQLSSSATLKIIRFLQDVHESMESTVSLKVHGTPVSLRAYCLVFVFIFPIVFTPTIVHHMSEAPVWVIYTLSLMHGFILVSLYNVQADMENPFDQVGLDDVKLEEYRFLQMIPAQMGVDAPPLAEPQPDPAQADEPQPDPDSASADEPPAVERREARESSDKD